MPLTKNQRRYAKRSARKKQAKEASTTIKVEKKDSIVNLVSSVTITESKLQQDNEIHIFERDLQKYSSEFSPSWEFPPKFKYCIAQSQRRANEDIFIVENYGKLHFYAICDGHGSAHNVTNTHPISILKKFLGQTIIKHYDSNCCNIIEKLKKTIENAFLEMDETMQKMSQVDRFVGSTCVAVLVDLGRQIFFTIQLGDSLCYLISKTSKTTQIKGQSPSDIEESKRIRDAGSFVICDRILGNLAVSRSFGDFGYKEITTKDQTLPYSGRNGPVSAVPQIQLFQLNQYKGFWLASDGLTERTGIDLTQTKYDALSPVEVMPSTRESTDDTTIMKVEF